MLYPMADAAAFSGIRDMAVTSKGDQDKKYETFGETFAEAQNDIFTRRSFTISPSKQAVIGSGPKTFRNAHNETFQVNTN